MRAWFATIGVGVLLGGTPALGDVVHLTNGRRIEGKVVDERRGAVHLEVPGGRVVLPASSVDRIERRDTPQEEYGQRARATDMADPDAVDALASWASARGLGDQADHLRALAHGLRLERRVAAVRGSRHAQDWVDVYQWSRGAGASLEVQRWLVEQASALDPQHPAVRAAVRSLEFDAVMADSVGQAPAPPARRAPEPRRDDARVAMLEAELAQRDLEERALRERLAQAEQQQRRRRVRRRGPGVVLPLPAAPCPAPEAPAPAPVVLRPRSR